MDPCLFKRIEEDGSTTFVAVYVDDLIIASKGDDTVKDLMKELSECYDLRDEGELNYFLGMEIKRGLRKFFLSQKNLTKEVIVNTNLSYLLNHI